MPVVRTMTPDDLEEVINLGVLAFTDYWHQTGHAGSFPARCGKIFWVMRLNPEGCFVAVDDRLAGYVFSRRWGRRAGSAPSGSVRKSGAGGSAGCFWRRPSGIYAGRAAPSGLQAP